MRFALVLLALPLPALLAAQTQSTRRETVQVLESRTIPRDVADDVSRVFNAPTTLRLTGAQSIEAGQEISSDIGIIDGALEIRGLLTGRLVAINAEVIVHATGRLSRDVTILGGRFASRDGGEVSGDVRVYRDHVAVDHDVDRIVVHDEKDDEDWLQRRERWRRRAWSDLRFLSARTYNRVEGLPLLVGPAFGRALDWGRVTVDALGIIRSADGFDWKSENVGHTVKAELNIGKGQGVRFGARSFEFVDGVEPWHLSDAEVGLGSFLLHRDYRDYFERHGGSLYAALFRGGSTDLTVAYSAQRWASRAARTPYTLFRREQDWRPNPQLDDGTFHVVNVTWRYDTRNDESDPWSGWYVSADYEFATGVISHYGPTSPLVRPLDANGQTAYDRGFVDIRRYNRVSPEGQVNLRLVLGGWLSGDNLPLERRFSVGGPGTLPGFDFRRLAGRTDYWHCSGPLRSTTLSGPLYPAGVPAQCERVALGQLEYRGEIHIDPFGVLGEERDRRRRGWGRGAQWVAFADAGRGWLVGPRDGEMRFGRSQVPPLSTFRADVGIGIRLDDIGLYLAKAVSDADAPMNFFVRLRPRF